MKITINRMALMLISILFSQNGSAQTGPSGAGNSSNTMIWLDAHSLNLPDGTPVSTWNDLSGNGSNFSQASTAKQPLFNSDGISAISSLSFDGVNDLLFSSAIAGLNASNITYFIVYDRTTTSSDMLISASYASNANKWRTYMNNGQNTILSAQYSPLINWVRYTDPAGASFLSTHITPTQIRTYNQGNLAMTRTATFTTPTGHTNVFLGNRNNATISYYTFTGEIAEVIVYNTVLNNLQRVLVENYLGAKYQLSIPTDLFAFQATHRFGLIGIGSNGVNTQTSAQGAGVVQIADPTDLSSNEYLLAAHTDFRMDEYNEIDLPALLPLHQRLERTWRVDETGETGTVSLTFQLGLDDFATSDSYRLLVDNDGIFSDATIHTGVYDAGTASVTFTVNLNDGDYFTLAGIQEILVIHSITTGLWSEITTWDCACIPSINDVVFIDPLTTVTIDVSAIANELTVESSGVLEMDTENGLTLTGNLTIIGTLTFLDGTLSLIGNGAQLITNSTTSPTVTTFNDLEINNSGADEVLFSNGTFLLNGLCSPLQGNIVFSGTTNFVITSTGPVSGGRVGPIIAPCNITGNVVVQRFIAPGLTDWRNLCSPVLSNTFDDWDADLGMSGPDFPDGCASGVDEPCFHSVRYTDHSISTDVLSSTDPILNGRGYEVFVGTDLEFFDGTTLNNTGPLNNSSGILKSFSTGWTTIGNPYACPIAYNAISKSGSISKYFYVYDANTGAYQWYDETSGTSSIPEITANGLIATGQAVWVFATGAGTMTFEQANKSTADALFIRGQLPESEAIEIKMSEENTPFFTSIQLEENVDATANYDETLDIPDFRSGHEKAPSLGLITNTTILRKNYCKSLLNKQQFWLDYSVNHAGTYSVQLSNLPPQFSEQSILLIDHHSQDTIDLGVSPYTFKESGANQSVNRFELLISPKNELKLNEQSFGLNSFTIDVQQLNHTLILTNNRTNSMNVQVKISNLLGETVYEIDSFTLNAGRNDIILPSYLRGLYIVQFKMDHHYQNNKIMLN